MRIVEKMALKERDNLNHGGVTIAFLGDSVTQGCFEIYKKSNGGLETVYDQQNSYEAGVWRILSTLYPSCTVNIINAGINGDTATGGLGRLERDVLRHDPDLCVVCYGLNDCSPAEGAIERYAESLRSIFKKIRESGSEIIFMTPNMMNTYVSPHVSDPDFIRIAAMIAERQNSGLFDAYMDAARGVCQELEVRVCDCYSIWKKLYENGVNTTELLSNKINHPTREMNKMFSYELVRSMMM